jgi:thiol-disulfide isomerase/thioredoxin
MKVDNYCIALAVVLLFLIYMDNASNIESFYGSDSLMGTPLDSKDNSQDHKPVEVIEHKTMEEGPIGQVPRKVPMAPTKSMGGSLEALQGAPIGENFMLLSADMVPGIKTIDSNVPVAYPRLGGYGNLGKDGSAPGVAPDVAPGAAPGAATGAGKSIKVIVIFAPWCGWSKKSLPDFKKMEGKLKSVSTQETNGWSVSFDMYNSEDAVGKQKVKEYEVKGFPSVLVEVDGQRKEGPREYSKMIDMINSVTGGNIQA